MEVNLKRFSLLNFCRVGFCILIALFLLSFSLPVIFAQEEEPLITANGEMWLLGSGGGNAVLNLKVSQALLDMGFTLDSFTQDIQADESAKVTSAQDLGGGNYRVAFKWEDGKKFFGEDSVVSNPDGSITFDLGDLSSFGTLTVHVQGNITETAGEKLSNDTVVFRNSPEGTVTFKPSGIITPPSPTTPPTTITPPPTTPPTGFTPPTGSPPPTTPPTASPSPSGGGLSTTWIIIIAFGGLFLIAILVLVVSLSMRKRRPPQAGYPYAPPPPPTQAGPAPGYMFCPNCGKQIPQGTKFCTYCGYQIGTPTPPQTPPPQSPPPPETPQS